MPRSYRLNISAVGLALSAIITIAICVAFVGWARTVSAEYERQAHYHTADYAEHTYRKQRDSCIGLVDKDKHECEWKADEAKRTYEHDQEDLVAQKSAALWGYVMGVSAVLGMGLRVKTQSGT